MIEIKKTYNLFLDDIRIPKDAWQYKYYTPYLKEEWKIVRDYKQFVDYISRNYKKGFFPKFISFDHDLCDEHYAPREHWSEKYNAWAESKNFKEKTGMGCAKWLIDFCMDNNVKLPEYMVHSMNPAGAENIQSILDNYKKYEENGYEIKKRIERFH